MRYGLIGTCYNTGISHIAAGFAEHLDMKVLLVDHKPFTKFPERFKNHRQTKEISRADIDWLLTDIDVLFTIETPYEWQIYAEAQKRGIKTVLMPMIEWLNRSRPELKNVDLYVCPSTYTFDALPGVNKVLVPCEVPVDLKKFKTRKITEARVFLHNAGHGGVMGRNSTLELMAAIKLVKSDAQFIIRSQFQIPHKVQDSRVKYIEGNVQDYWDLYEFGDVWIMPWKYGVAALGLQESMAAGMLPVITDMPPFREYMPKELLIEPMALTKRHIHAGQNELFALQSPELIAKKIDELYTSDIQPLQQWANKTAKEWSWDVWKQKYQDIFTKLCENKI